MTVTRVLNRAASGGYREIMSMVRLDDIKHDPWGTALAYLGGIADIVYGVDGEIMDGYRPSVLFDLATSIEENGTTGDLYALYEDGLITTDDMWAAYHILSRFADWAERAGRSY